MYYTGVAHAAGIAGTEGTEGTVGTEGSEGMLFAGWDLYDAALAHHTTPCHNGNHHIADNSGSRCSTVDVDIKYIRY